MNIHPTRNHRQHNILVHSHQEMGGFLLAAIQATWTPNGRSVYSSRNSCNRKYSIHNASQALSSDETSGDSEAVHLVAVVKSAKPMKL